MEQMPSNTPVMESKPGPAGWLEVWIKAITKPSEQTFIEISESPDAKTQTALIWAAIAGIISGIAISVSFVLQSFLVGDGSSNDVGVIALFVCGFPIGLAVINLIGLSLSTALFQWVAKLFGGVGSFEKLIYPISAIAVPVSVFSGILSMFSAIPLVGMCLSIFTYAVSAYAAFLNIVAVKAVNRFDWGRAAGSVLIPAFTIGIFCGCIAVGGLMILGPQIGEVFSGINQGFAP